MKLTKTKLKEIIREEIQKLNEASYTHNYRSLKDRYKVTDRIWGTTNGLGNIGHPRVNIKFSKEVEKTGRMRPSSIAIDGEKVWVDAYKKIAFNGNGTFHEVVKFVRKKLGDSNA